MIGEHSAGSSTVHVLVHPGRIAAVTLLGAVDDAVAAAGLGIRCVTDAPAQHDQKHRDSESRLPWNVHA